MPDLETIIQGGAVGIAVLLILLLTFIFKKLFEFFTNHINHNTKAMIEFKEAIQHLIEYLKNGK